MSAVAIIPARFASVRFPGKVLANRTGRPLIQHVYERALQARHVDAVLVAADDMRIVEAVKRFGGRAVMTNPDHPNGTCRLAEAAAEVDADLIVNVQGDEPEIEPALIDLAIETLEARPECPMGTLASPFIDDENPRDPNVVKVVVDSSSRALYFSRRLIPYDRDGAGVATPLKHVGLYVYRRPFLQVYVNLPPTPLEQVEKLEQLRVLEHGYPIAVAIGEARFHGIDTPEQYDEFVARHNARETIAPPSADPR